MALTCSKGQVFSGATAGFPDITLCTKTDSMNVNVSAAGDIGESRHFTGYVRLLLQRAPENAEIWVDVATVNAGYWANSSKNQLSATFKNIGQPGSTMRVLARFYQNSSYTGDHDTITHMFIR